MRIHAHIMRRGARGRSCTAIACTSTLGRRHRGCLDGGEGIRARRSRTTGQIHHLVARKAQVLPQLRNIFFVPTPSNNVVMLFSQCDTLRRGCSTIGRNLAY